jgi:hypothetical protein
MLAISNSTANALWSYGISMHGIAASQRGHGLGAMYDRSSARQTSRHTEDRLECCGAQSMSEVGQNLLPRFATAMEELARRPDANEANCWHVAGCRTGRPLPQSLRRQHYPRKPPSRPAGVASETGHLRSFQCGSFLLNMRFQGTDAVFIWYLVFRGP